ncbi:AraC family transcriptional regulator [Paenibacillus thalictri]|uniref:AraC family transcriptional regulator n=1 Tax=Paenibacillus thalictri TaxID=2527873 RepID=A0A4V2J374_9BACL|nr:AraC family transcriptional regulator [Paenibacillus thalictri]TBL70285.1 AraC family transcriptional regulator [Paenibacillus thalictri]
MMDRLPEKIIVNSSSYIDSNVGLTPYYWGYHTCPAGHKYGPAARDHYFIHYIMKGKGIFQLNKDTYSLMAGQGFLISPNDICYYRADEDDPWVYTFWGFNGIDAAQYLNRAQLNSANPIFTHTYDDQLAQLIDKMIHLSTIIQSRDIMFTGLLFQLLSILIENSSGEIKSEHTKELYVKKAIDYIHRNYSNKTSIHEIANFVGLDRKYLSTVFKNISGVSPQEYLVNYRINKACELMTNPALSIGDIARSIGYDDPFLFSKVFKKIKGCSPRNFRNSL